MTTTQVEKGNRFIHFKKLEAKYRYWDSTNTDAWLVINRKSNEPIARIEWYPYWKQYVLLPQPLTVYNDVCLECIIAFIKRLNVKPETNQTAPKGKGV